MSILAAIGEDPHAEEIVLQASELAAKYGEELVVLHVIPETDFESHQNEIQRASSDFQDLSFSQEESSGAQYAYRIVERAIDEDPKQAIETQGRVGDPATKILEEAALIDPTYVVIGGRRRSPVGKAFLGSVTQEVLLKAEFPVVTIMKE